jgi:hypothetical protein
MPRAAVDGRYARGSEYSVGLFKWEQVDVDSMPPVTLQLDFAGSSRRQRWMRVPLRQRRSSGDVLKHSRHRTDMRAGHLPDCSASDPAHRSTNIAPDWHFLVQVGAGA